MMTTQSLPGLVGLKARREAAGMTQDDLARALDACRTTVANWENGTSVPCARLLPNIADLLLCSIDDLYGRPVGYFIKGVKVVKPEDLGDLIGFDVDELSLREEGEKCGI